MDADSKKNRDLLLEQQDSLDQLDDVPVPKPCAHNTSSDANNNKIIKDCNAGGDSIEGSLDGALAELPKLSAALPFVVQELKVIVSQTLKLRPDILCENA